MNNQELEPILKDLQLLDTISDHIYIYINEETTSGNYDWAKTHYEVEESKIREDLEKLDKYLDDDVNVYITPGKSRRSYAGYAIPSGKNLLMRYLKPTHYNVVVYSSQLYALNHEIMHVIDKASSHARLSSKKEFKPILKDYKHFIRQSRYTDVADNNYSNGMQESEVFVRLLEHWVDNREGLNYTNFHRTAFDRAVTDYYNTYNKKIDGYFDTLFADQISNDDDFHQDFNKSIKDIPKNIGPTL